MQRLRLLLLQSAELEQRINRKKLRTGFFIKRFPVHHAQRAVKNAVRTRVAVVNRISQKFAAFIEQTEIHAPRIKGHAVKRTRFFDSGTDLAHELFKIPTEMSLRLARIVLKAMNLFPGKNAVVINAANGASA